MNNSKKDYSCTYYNDCGRYQDDYERLCDEHIPAMGNSSSSFGSALRCITNVVYDYYNNGGGNLVHYDNEDPCWDPYYDDMFDELSKHVGSDYVERLQDFIELVVWENSHLVVWNNSHSNVDRMEQIFDEIIDKLVASQLE